LALRLSALASALAQEKGETLVVGWRETDDGMNWWTLPRLGRASISRHA
jgi:hypothetical protein